MPLAAAFGGLALAATALLHLAPRPGVDLALVLLPHQQPLAAIGDMAHAGGGLIRTAAEGRVLIMRDLGDRLAANLRQRGYWAVFALPRADDCGAAPPRLRPTPSIVPLLALTSSLRGRRK